MFAEIIFTEDGLGFVPFVMNQFAFVSWLLRCTGLRKPKPGCDRATDLVGIHKMKELRNQITVRLQAGVRGSAHVSRSTLQKLRFKGELKSVEVVEINLDGKAVRVLPKFHGDRDMIYVCPEDLLPAIAFIKQRGLQREHDDPLPAGIRKRVSRDGKESFNIRQKTGDGKTKYITRKTSEEAIEALGQQSADE